MGLLSRSPSTPRPARVPRQRVRLSPDELRLTGRLKPIERKIAWAIAAGSSILLVVAWLDVGLDKKQLGTTGGVVMAGGILANVLLALVARGRSRLIVGVVAMLNVFCFPGVKGSPAYYQLASYPSLLFLMFLTLRMSNDRRRAMEAKIARGGTDLPASERPAPRKRRKGAAEASAEDETAATRPVAPPSKRYTPPKHRPAKTRR